MVFFPFPVSLEDPAKQQKVQTNNALSLWVRQPNNNKYLSFSDAVKQPGSWELLSLLVSRKDTFELILID